MHHRQRRHGTCSAWREVIDVTGGVRHRLLMLVQDSDNDERWALRGAAGHRGGAGAVGRLGVRLSRRQAADRRLLSRGARRARRQARPRSRVYGSVHGGEATRRWSDIDLFVVHRGDHADPSPRRFCARRCGCAINRWRASERGSRNWARAVSSWTTAPGTGTSSRICGPARSSPCDGGRVSNHERWSELAGALDAAAADDGTGSLSAAVRHRSRTVWTHAAGWADRERGRAVRMPPPSSGWGRSARRWRW